jgi:hypothetical protein
VTASSDDGGVETLRSACDTRGRNLEPGLANWIYSVQMKGQSWAASAATATVVAGAALPQLRVGHGEGVGRGAAPPRSLAPTSQHVGGVR